MTYRRQAMLSLGLVASLGCGDSADCRRSEDCGACGLCVEGGCIQVAQARCGELTDPPIVPSEDAIHLPLATHVAIDGDPADWDGFERVELQESRDPTKLAAAFSAQWDYDYLYVAVFVTDDVAISAPPVGLHPDSDWGDRVVLYLDLRPDQSLGTRYDEWEAAVQVTLSSQVVDPKGLWTGEARAALTTGSSWWVEAKLEWPWHLAPMPGFSIGSDMAIYDEDRPPSSPAASTDLILWYDRFAKPDDRIGRLGTWVFDGGTP
ncbi:MAG: hypothetical protein IPK13_07740 [Deltaproteobacteria bacterium]|nr:hypothetical protein [Deltaproteobacteria bacterium]